MSEQYQTIVKALQHLAGVCDGAKEQDGQGFNGRDTRFGKSLAEQSAVRTLSEKQQAAALEMLQTYRGQLEAAGIDLPKAESYKVYTNGNAAPKPKAEEISGSISLAKKEIVVSFGYHPDLVAKVKSLPERKFDGKSKTWRVPVRLATEVVEMFPQFTIDQSVSDLVQSQNQLASMSNRATSDFEIPGIKGQPLPYQRAGVQFLETAGGRGIIADQMGLGKTLQSLAYMQLHPDKRPAIIIVPASLKINWQREIAKWLSTDEKIHLITGRKTYPLIGQTIYIINYDIVSYWSDELIKLNAPVLIADEAHYCKNAQSKRSKAVKKLAGKIPHTILLTGTPVTNRPLELFPLLNMVDSTAWPSFWPYAKRYCGAYNDGWGWNFSGATNLDELHQKIKPYVVRRTKDQVLTELPAKRRVTVPFEMTADKAKEYKHQLEETARILREAQRGAMDAHHLARIEKLKQIAVGGKLPAAIEWLKDFTESGQKIIVFATHKFVVAELMAAFGDQAVKVTGDDSQDERQTAVDAFQNDPSKLVFVGNIKAAGVGLTLTAASDVAFLEFAWTPGDHDQAEDRAHRIGQQDNVTCWYLVALGTMDEKIIDLLEQKRQIVDQVTDGKSGDLKFSIMNELANEITK